LSSKGEHNNGKSINNCACHLGVVRACVIEITNIKKIGTTIAN
jgi:hypothetical protein